jgi:hypothetical protein
VIGRTRFPHPSDQTKCGVPVNEGMKSSQRVNVKVAVVEKNEVLLRLWSWALYGFAVIAAILFVQLRIAAILGHF